MTETPAHPDRRTLLRGGAAALGLTVAGAGALSATGVAGAAPVPALSGRSGQFDLWGRTHAFFDQRPLAHATVMQSFTFDNTAHHLYAAQLTDKAAGHLSLTRFTPVSTAKGVHWRTDGTMALLNAGHGVSIAAHDGRLWTEADAQGGTDGAYGRRLATFRFVKDGTVNLSPRAQGPGVAHPDAFHLPHAGFDQYTCAVDPTPGHEHLVIRYSRREHGVRRYYYEVFTIGDALAGRWSNPVVPRLRQPRLARDFQGYTAKGRFLYFFTGTAKDADDPQLSQLYCYNMKTHAFTGIATTKAGQSLPHREPEGLAVYYPANGYPRLFFGFATGTPHHFTATLFYKQKAL